MLLTFIHPVISAYVRAIDPSAKQVIALLMLVMIIADTVKTLLKAEALKAVNIMRSVVLSRKSKKN